MRSLPVFQGHCIAGDGTSSGARDWVQLRPDGEPTARTGRVCTRQAKTASSRYCGSCPAYRGRRRDTTVATGLWPDGSPYGLTDREYREWQAAMDAALIDDDPFPMRAFQSRFAPGGRFGARVMRRNGDPDATEAWAAYHREYYAQHRERINEQRREGRSARTRELERERQRRRRSRINTPAGKALIRAREEGPSTS